MTIETRSALAAAALAPLISLPGAFGVTIFDFIETRITGAPQPVTETFSASFFFGFLATLVAYLCMVVAGLPAALVALRFRPSHLWVAC